MTRYGLGPVFALEWLRTSRRWQLFAVRAFFILGLLIGIFIVHFTIPDTRFVSKLRQQAEVGRQLFYFVTGIQITVLLLAAPAATAGGFCIDKARGALLQLLVTDLSATEIVLGKLAARLLPTLGLIACSVPVLYLCTWFGGIDTEALLGFYLVSAGVAIFGCALTLTLSVWGKHTHEVLLVTYMIWLLVLLARPLYDNAGTFLALWGPAPPWVDLLDPYWVTYAPYWSPGTTSWREPTLFLGGAVVASALLTILAGARIRAVTVRQAGSSEGKRGRWSIFFRLPRFLGPSLNRNPVAWREWHRKRLKGWVGLVLLVYALLATFFSLVALQLVRTSPGMTGYIFACFVNGLQVAVGLLFISISSVTALAEERVRGSLDLLLVTPLSSWEIIWGKWWGSYRKMPLLVILPCLLTVVLAWKPQSWECPALLLPFLLAHGAFFTSVGVLIATIVARLNRAITIGAIVYAAMTIGWPLVAILFVRHTQQSEGILFGSPGLGTIVLSAATFESRAGGGLDHVSWALLWIAGLWILAGMFLLATLVSFDYFLGRVSAFLPYRSSAPRPAREQTEVVDYVASP
jgi:ABC-type transport system involved in multi-copper enzyme maturation permease subunit